VALVLVAELVGLVALATRYTTTEAHPSESRGSLAIAVVASEDGGTRGLAFSGSLPDGPDFLLCPKKVPRGRGLYPRHLAPTFRFSLTSLV
jgi:hypothetical protein